MGYAPASNVANGGTITGSLAGVYLDDGGTFTNTASYALITGGQYGLRANNTAATIGNAGTITGGSSGIYLSDGGTVTNSGTISGGSAIFAQNGSFTLNELAGGVFQGAVTDQPGHGVLNLAGATAGALDMGGSFSGFATINFGAAAWTLGGTSSELANGETITGFVLGDTIQLEGFAATAASYIAGTGLVLTNATARETIRFSGGDQYFSIASVGTTGTDIIAANPSLTTPSPPALPTASPSPPRATTARPSPSPPPAPSTPPAPPPSTAISPPRTCSTRAPSSPRSRTTPPA